MQQFEEIFKERKVCMLLCLDDDTLQSIYMDRFHRLKILCMRELKEPRRRRQQGRQKFAYLTTKTTVFLHALHVHSSFFYILQTFSFFLRREMTCFVVVWTT